MKGATGEILDVYRQVLVEKELTDRTQDPTFVAGPALRAKIDKQHEDVRRIVAKYKVQ